MSIELEQAIVVSCLQDPKALDTALAQVNHEHFEDEELKVIYGLCRELRGKSKAVDMQAIWDELDRRNLWEQIGGMSYFAQIHQNYIGTPKNIQVYISRWKDRQMLRAVRSIGFQLVEQAQSASSADEAIAAALQLLSGMQTGEAQSGPVEIKETLKRAIQEIDLRVQNGGATGISTGFPELDKRIGNMRPGNFIVGAGRPGMGKTAWVMNVAEHVAMHCDKGVYVASLEMDEVELGIRMISSGGDIDMGALMSGQLTDEDYRGMNAALSKLHETKIEIDTTANTVPLIAAGARRLRARQGLALIIVDYIQLMSGEGKENRTQEVSSITRGLKLLAKELGVPIVALSQLSRDVESRADKRPVLSDLRESGSIEQDADAVIMLYRDDYYNPQSPNKGIGELIVRKARMGVLGTVYARFEGQHSRYRPVTLAEAAMYAQANTAEIKPMRRPASKL